MVLLMHIRVNFISLILYLIIMQIKNAFIIYAFNTHNNFLIHINDCI